LQRVTCSEDGFNFGPHVYCTQRLSGVGMDMWAQTFAAAVQCLADCRGSVDALTLDFSDALPAGCDCGAACQVLHALGPKLRRLHLACLHIDNVDGSGADAENQRAWFKPAHMFQVAEALPNLESLGCSYDDSTNVSTSLQAALALGQWPALRHVHVGGCMKGLQDAWPWVAAACVHSCTHHGEPLCMHLERLPQQVLDEVQAVIARKAAAANKVMVFVDRCIY
jgi:hypothetical protein